MSTEIWNRYTVIQQWGYPMDGELDLYSNSKSSTSSFPSLHLSFLNLVVGPDGWVLNCTVWIPHRLHPFLFFIQK